MHALEVVSESLLLMISTMSLQAVRGMSTHSKEVSHTRVWPVNKVPSRKQSVPLARSLPWSRQWYYPEVRDCLSYNMKASVTLH